MKNRKELKENPISLPIGFLIELSETHNHREVLETFARWARLMVDCDQVAVLLDAEDGYFKRWCVENGAIVFRQRALRVSASSIWKKFREKHCTIVADLTADSADDTGFEADPDLKLAIYAPIFFGTQTKGMLVATYRTGRDELVKDKLILETLGRSLGTYLLLHDQVEQLAQQALTDPLTGLKNRRYFDGIGAETLQNARSSEQHTALLLLDIDHFKTVNDTYGHQAGDLVLKHVGNTLLHVSRKTDSVIRMGGEEFCILMQGVRLDELANIAERTRSAIENADISVGDKRVRITVSIGTASVEQGFEAFEDLLKAADEALYEAKRDGRNLVRQGKLPDVA